jgi:aromatic-L-amino-acid/L-tryptophan decarboxylase
MDHPLEPSASALLEMTELAVKHVREYVLSLAEQPSFDLDGVEEALIPFLEPAPEAGRRLDELLPRVFAAAKKGFNTAGPGYLAFIPGGGLYAAAVADYVSLALNRYVGVNVAAPLLAQIERTSIGWLGGMMGYPASARGLLTSGGSMSNLVALVAARTAKLGEDILRGTVYASRETHLSVTKAARFAGIPARNVRSLPVDARLRLDVGALERAIDEDRARGLRPFFVVANVGTTNTGAIDPVEPILDVARRSGLWVHADAAYGGFFRLVPGYDAPMRGIDRCDSITLDPHKGLFLPYGTGCLLVRDVGALRDAHAGEADYLREVAAEGDEPNFADTSPELSREFRGLRLWLPLALYGVGAFRAELAEKLALARAAYEALRDDGRFEIVDEPQLSVVAFRLRASDEVNRELLRRVNARRRVFLSSTTLSGKLVLRICVLSFRTHEERVQHAVRALREEATGLLAQR